MRIITIVYILGISFQIIHSLIVILGSYTLITESHQVTHYQGNFSTFSQRFHPFYYIMQHKVLDVTTLQLYEH